MSGRHLKEGLASACLDLRSQANDVTRGVPFSAAYKSLCFVRCTTFFSGEQHSNMPAALSTAARRKKTQRFREWKSKTTKLRALRQRLKVQEQNLTPDDAHSLAKAGFSPEKHGFNFQSETFGADEVNTNFEMMEVGEEASRKRKLFDTTEEKKPWYCRFLPDQAQLHSNFNKSYER